MATSRNIPPTSFMNLFNEIVYDKSQTPNPSLDIWDAYVIGPFQKDALRYFQIHRVEIGETWVQLSRYYYSDERLWWVIPLFNDIENPFLLTQTSLDRLGITELQVLKPEYINQLLLLARQQKITSDRTRNNRKTNDPFSEN